MLPYVTIGTFQVSTYWAMYGVGLGSMLWLVLRRRKRYALSAGKGVAFFLFLAVLGTVGAKLLAILEGWIPLVLFGEGKSAGFSYFGAVFLIFLLIGPLGRLLGLTAGDSRDLAAPCGPAQVAFMRLGCFLNGCCGGWVTSWGFRWPTQAMESVGDFAILSWLLTVEDRGGRGLYPRFLVSYGAMRFCIEFLRDTEKAYLRLSDGQWCALAAVLIGAWALQRGRRRIRAAK